MSSICENVFDVIDTKEKAYWLGLIYADGNISKDQNRTGFHLAYKDKILMEKLADFLGDDRTRIKSYDNNKTLFYYVYSNRIKEDLIKHGVVVNKTASNIFPKIDNYELFLAFFTGAYDGDGTHKASSISSNNVDFLNHCRERFNLPETKITYRKNHWGSCYSLHIGVKIYEDMMVNYDDSLERKRFTSKYFPSKDYKNTKFDKDKILDEINRNGIDVCSKNLNIPIHHIQYFIQPYIKHEKILVSSSSKVCEKCGTFIDKNSTWCKPCSSQVRGKLYQKYTISKEELQILVDTTPFTSIGKMFGVSDNAIRKRCKREGVIIPKREPGYWTIKKYEK